MTNGGDKVVEKEVGEIPKFVVASPGGTADLLTRFHTLHAASVYKISCRSDLATASMQW